MGRQAALADAAYPSGAAPGSDPVTRRPPRGVRPWPFAERVSPRRVRETTRIDTERYERPKSGIPSQDWLSAENTLSAEAHLTLLAVKRPRVRIPPAPPYGPRVQRRWHHRGSLQLIGAATAVRRCRYAARPVSADGPGPVVGLTVGSGTRRSQPYPLGTGAARGRAGGPALRLRATTDRELSSGADGCL